MPIEACIFNHNTSPFAELALRSLFATEQDSLPRVTVSDNHSTDDGLVDLRTAADELGATFIHSRWPAEEANLNTHGDAIRDFVLSKRDAEYFLLVDADIVFTQAGTIATMRGELDDRSDAWAVQAAFHWAEEHRGSGASLNIGHDAERTMTLRNGRVQTYRGKPRCHPGCTLIRNSAGFLRVAETIGFSCAEVVSGDPDVGGFHDTMGLASHAMATQGLSYFLSAARVVHYFNVSYDENTALTAEKLDDCRRRLASLRDNPTGPIAAGPWG